MWKTKILVWDGEIFLHFKLEWINEYFKLKQYNPFWYDSPPGNKIFLTSPLEFKVTKFQFPCNLRGLHTIVFVYVFFHCSIHHNIQVWENCSCLEIENELHTLWDSVKIQILLMTCWWCRVCVCVCVCVCVRVCVCVCVFILFHREGLFRLQDVWDILEGHISTMLCCEYHSRCFCQVPLSPYLKISYFTSKDETPARPQTGEKRCDIYGSDIYDIDIGYNSASDQNRRVKKRY